MRIRIDRLVLRRLGSGMRAQLLLMLLPCIALMLLMDSWSDHEHRTRALDSAYDEALTEPISVLDDSVQLGGDGAIGLAAPVAVQALLESAHSLHKDLHVGLVPLDAAAAAGERTLLGVGDLPLPPAALVAASGRIAFYNGTYHGVPVRVGLLQRELRDASGHRFRLQVQAAESRSRRLQARAASLWRELEQDLGMLAVTALVVWLGIARALRPLRRLRQSLRARPAHDLRPLDGAAVPYDLAPLVDAVNHHIADHRRLLADQSRFLADASHQLRTPLAIMMTQAGYALRERDPALLRETLLAILAQLGRSQRLSDQLLSMAHASRAGPANGTPPLVDLNVVAREVVLQYLPLAHAKNQDLGWDDIRGGEVDDGDEPGLVAAPVRAEAAELHEALANLVHNAINHTQPHGRITVAVRKQGALAWAEVRDSGPGIPLESRATVFERFSRSGAGGTGAGLGLAIARAYARRNGGDIVLSDAAPAAAAGTGLCARLQLPLVAAPGAVLDRPASTPG